MTVLTNADSHFDFVFRLLRLRAVRCLVFRWVVMSRLVVRQATPQASKIGKMALASTLNGEDIGQASLRDNSVRREGTAALTWIKSDHGIRCATSDPWSITERRRINRAQTERLDRKSVV